MLKKLLLLMLAAVTLTAYTLNAQPAEAAPKKGGTLVFARGADSPGLDPAYETDGNSFMVCDNIYDALVGFEPESTALTPSLATSWDISEDGMTYTFHLREGVSFHDGTPFDADAVVFSHGRQMKDKTRAKFFQKQWDWPVNAPAPEYWLSMEMDDIIESIEATDAYTVVYKLKRPEAPFIANMAMDFADIVSPTAVLKHGADYITNPVGTGPFKITSWQKNDRITLERFDAHWNGAPYLDKVIFRVIPDNSVRFLELMSGNVHICQYPNPEDVELAKSNPNLAVITQPGMNVGYLSFNHTKELWQDPRIRRAIAHAVNKQAIVDNIYYGMGVPAVNTIPPTLWGYNDELTGHEYNPEKARQLLKEADFEGKLKAAGQDKITLWCMPVARPYNPSGMKVGEAIQADLKAVGINVELVTMEWGTYLKKQRTQDPAMDLFQLGWTGDNGDPDNFLAILLDGLADPNVRTQWKNEEYHELMVAGKRTTDQAKRAEIYKKAQALIHQDVPMINMAHSIVAQPQHKRVQDFKLHPTTSVYLHKVWMK
ncbi:ABC transporter substrate-binding protein [Oleidesulfovibrio sp.]|uniref:ABC transporter substrate-binding protein n=1 Tax=Oleidesulfovibrio sp. TaxID=2909707 RepID=UPI003A893BAB